MLKLILLALYLGHSLCLEVPADSRNCDLPCMSIRMIDAYLSKLPEDKIQVSNGVKFVKTSSDVVDGRSVRNSILTRFKRFLSNYELQVKLEDLLPRQQDVNASLRTALGYLNDLQSDDEETSRGKGGGGGLGGGKKGGGAVLMMATMMGGTMAALGFGALGMLAMKALTVSAMALLLSAVIGLKKLLSKGDDENAHVSYIPVHHGGHRRRRDVHDLPYRGYLNWKS